MAWIHDDETNIIVGAEIVGYRFENQLFTFEAVVQPDKTINIYVEWGDDQPGDLFNVNEWAEAKSILNMLLKASSF